MFYSKSTNGFYSTEINGDNMPSDVVEITQEYYEALLKGQSNGQLIVGDDAGYPILITPPVVPVEIKQVSMRQCRLALLQENQLVSVEALINTPEQKIWWDYSTVVEKDNQLVKDMAVALDWTPEYLTSLFELANTL